MFKISLETVFKINTESFYFYREIGSSPEIFIFIQTSNRQNPLFFISTFIYQKLFQVPGFWIFKLYLDFNFKIILILQFWFSGFSGSCVEKYYSVSDFTGNTEIQKYNNNNNNLSNISFQL